MGVKDKLLELGKIRVDFWNDAGRKQTVTVDLPQEKPFVKRRPKVVPTIAEEARREVLPPPIATPPLFVPLSESEPAKRLRKLLDEMPPPSPVKPVTFDPGPAPALDSPEWAPLRPEARSQDTSVTVPHVDPPVYAKVKTPTARSLRTESATCAQCYLTVSAFQTYADGRILCLPCSMHPRKGIHAV